MSAKVTLKVIRGPMQGNIYTFEEHDTFIFGRAYDCHARLPSNDKSASRHHFILEVNPPDARIRDLGSLNGTYINNIKYGGRSIDETPREAVKRRFPEVDLKDKDLISVGNTVFTVQIEMLAVCCQCGVDIPNNFRRACQWQAGLFICPQCREQTSLDATVPKAEDRTIPIYLAGARCANCNKPVSSELGNRHHGDYICLDCRTDATADPVQIIISMLNQTSSSVASTHNEIDGYEPIKKLGEGAMGSVYLARRRLDGAVVALKVMLARIAVDAEARGKFQREIQVISQLRHTNIVELLDQGSVGSGFYFIMELCAGGSLDTLIKRHGGKLPLAQADPIMRETLAGLTFAHENGFVHRDIKPANILLTAEYGGTIKLGDFGLAKSFQLAGLSGLTATGTAGGTPNFMPREQLINFKYSKPVSDVWSIAATFYFMLTGQPPREILPHRDPLEVILHGKVIPIRERNVEIPDRVARVIDRALSEEISERYQTAGEFRDALINVL
ncbi:MAG: protein kinase [Acidobacteriota bacterium]